MLVNKPSSQFTRKKIEEFSYGLSDVIGRGYSSQVYKGRHDDSEQPVAVKVIDMKMLKNEINRVLLQSQIQILKQLKQVPHVLKLHEVYTTKNNTYIITQLCSSDLNKKIKNKPSERQIYQLMDQIIQGYMEVYKKQIVHRDLKPANILLTHNDQCKIADFGFAIKAAQLLKPSKYNVGSPLYMAPESLRKNQYSYKTDLWSIGVIFFQMLTGQTPWKAKTEKELIKKIQNEKIQTVIEKKRLTFSGQVKDFLNKILCVDKYKRMEPQELGNYRFGQNSQLYNDNALTQKQTNVLENCGKDRISKLASPKNQIFARFNFPSSTTSKQGQKSLTPNCFFGKAKEEEHTRAPSCNASKNYLNNTLSSQKNISYHNNKENPHNSTNPQSQNILNRNEIKLISKQLISQIHFCRYLFKLLGRIKQSTNKGILRQHLSSARVLQENYTKIIKYKIEKLISFDKSNFLSIEQESYKKYKETSDFKKILKISKQYQERYKQQLISNWYRDCNDYEKMFTSVHTVELMNNLIWSFQQHSSLELQSNISKYEKEVIILDYLITAKQLLEMLGQGENYEKFARKSKIEEIVEGTTTTITYELFGRIMARGKQLVGFTLQ